MNLPIPAPSANRLSTTLSFRRRRPLQSLALVGAIIAALPVACTAQAPTAPIAPPPSATPSAPIVAGLPDFTQLVQRVGPAVVNISAEVTPKRVARSRNQMPDEDQVPEFFRRFFGPDFPGPGGGQGQGPRQPRGGARSIGSGFLISQDGYVLTNHHVVDGADTVTVKLTDRREFKAKVIGSDEQSDVALLKIDAKGLPFLRSANASLTKAGQWVVAIGSPFGLDHSVTAGIVSAVGRANPYADQRYVPFIQTDVAINQGNSGGPLLNTAGEVVGINSQIFSNSGGYMGVSFAIPIDVAMNSAEQLRAKGKVSRGQLGVVVQALTAETAKGFGLPDSSGALIAQVVPGGPAEKAGLQAGDIIRTVNGAEVRESSDLPPLIGNMAPGSKARLGVFREGKTVEISVAVNELDPNLAGEAGGAGPSDRDGAPAAPSAKGNPLSLVAQDVDAAARQRLGLKAGEGVIVRDPGDAGDAGVRPGDVVLSVGRTPVGNVAALNRALAGARPGQTVMLLIRRGAQTQFIAVQPAEAK
ncbi:Do family serine endopeptidase [Lysobacter enzymogenes]|uniref:Probable periplasmic serine endoprotease DegP-like n=1 Tax=Lysobacter enzymogenes TaxID=69 RepID=A0AAU9AN58_LYSEN|nr:Do family serine endopeptidase [Lysobacter enzymogenes]BAV98749.1 periplasmic protease [Lysobacter enzymogenes]